MRYETMRYEIKPSEDFPGDWVAGAVDAEGEGEIYIALFSGPQARERAEEYAAWKNAGPDSSNCKDNQARLSTGRSRRRRDWGLSASVLVQKHRSAHPRFFR